MNIPSLLKICIEKQASDLHLVPSLRPFMRIDGELVVVPNTEVLSSEKAKELIFNIMTKEQSIEYETDRNIDIAYAVEALGNFRVSAYHQLLGNAAVIRILRNKVPSFEELGLPSLFKSLLVLSHGLILVTGPTGSGKSTTLATLIEHINMTRASNIISIEDPIEYIYQNKKAMINQIQVGRDTPDINSALRASLRQDPDVILLGEIRDRETVNLALSAAETGHLVMTTLHAGSAPLAISRIIDMFPDEEKNRVRNLLSETLQAAVCQTLVKKIEGGRTAAFEIMLATPAIRHQIRQDKIPHMSTTIQTNGHIGMCTMEQYLHELVVKGIVSLNAARAVTVNQGVFRQ